MVCWVISLITDFNPRSPDGERREVATPCCSISYFNPRSPDGERRYDAMYHPAQWRFQSTLPGWGATTMEFRTPLAGLISIHAPRMGSDKSPRRNSDSFYAFQSTLPGWGATYFNMRYRTLDMISIHAPRMGSDYGTRYNTAYSLLFQSTLPGWGATHYSDYRNRVVHISIHAPRMGSDITPIQWRKMTFISIHAPRMGSDLIHGRRQPPPTISIHAPRMGSDRRPPYTESYRLYFNPRSPDGERPRKWTSSPTIWAKSSIFNTDCIADRR